MKVQCDACGFKFKPKMKAMSVLIDGGGAGTAYFLKCPCCKRRFLSYVQTDEIREKQESLRKEFDLLKSKIDIIRAGEKVSESKIEELVNKAEELRVKQNVLKAEMEELKEKYKNIL